MKTEFVTISDTRKNLVVEIPSAVVDAEIERVARDYGRTARVPGFRPGKVPPRLLKQRFHDQILHEVARHLIPGAVDTALRDEGIEPIDTPDIRDVVVEESQPLRFTASFDTIPPIELGDWGSLALRRATVEVSDHAVEEALERLRYRAARYEPVGDRPAELGDTVVADLERFVEEPGAKSERHDNVSFEIGDTANPPGLDRELIGLTPGAERTFTLSYPADYAISALAGRQVRYHAKLNEIKRRILPALDDELARDVGEFDTLEALRDRIRQDLRQHAAEDAERQMRGHLLKQLAAWVRFELPAPLVERELDRRVEELARRLIDQRIDPRRANIDWDGFRESQLEPARETVASTLVLDEVARREQLTVSLEEIDRAVEQYAQRSGRTTAAARAALERENGISRLSIGLRRDKAIDFLLARATLEV